MILLRFKPGVFHQSRTPPNNACSRPHFAQRLTLAVRVRPAVLFPCRWETCQSTWVRTVAEKGRVSAARRNLKDPRQMTRPQPRLPKPGEPVGANPWRPDTALTGGRGTQRRPGGISRGCGWHGRTGDSPSRADRGGITRKGKAKAMRDQESDGPRGSEEARESLAERRGPLHAQPPAGKVGTRARGMGSPS